MTTTVGRVVVVGGGIAGVSTAAALRAEGFDGEVVLVDAGERPYDRPPLSKDFLAGEADVKELTLQPPEWYDDHRIELLSSTVATRLRPHEAVVELGSGVSLRADRVVLATGGRAARPPIAGADSSLVHTLRTVEDADRLRDRLVSGARLLVVGAGLIGAEVASTARFLGVDVVLADPVERPLEAVIGAEAAELLHGMHVDRGVRTVAAGVSCFEQRGDEIRAELQTGEIVTADVVLLGVGMLPAVELAQDAGLRIDRGIVVDETMTTSNAAVLAAGDPARVRSGGRFAEPAEHWDAAQVEARRCAGTILGRPPQPATAPWFWTDRHGHHVEVVGRVARCDRTVVRQAPGSFAVFGLSGGLVAGAIAVDDSLLVRAARRMIDRGVRVDPDALADPTTDLRKLLRR
ncbi:NAD(P)/FAD-dependent oxidoreductase [Kribbella sp. NPDC055071]